MDYSLITMLLGMGFFEVCCTESCEENYWSEPTRGYIQECPDIYIHVERIYFYHARVALVYKDKDIRVWHCPLKQLEFVVAQAKVIATIFSPIKEKSVMTETTADYRAIQINGGICKVRQINFAWISPFHPSVTPTWEEWLYGTTPEEFCKGFQCPSDAIMHFLTDAVENNPFELEKDTLESLDLDQIGSFLLAYINRESGEPG